MTTAELRGVVEAAVDAVDFTPPVSAAYCQAVYTELGKRAPGAIRDVHHGFADLPGPRRPDNERPQEVRIEARVGLVLVRLVLPCT